MNSTCRCCEIVTEGFEELALALGGVTASYEMPDAAIWDIAFAVDVAHGRVQARISQTGEVEQLDEVPDTGGRHTAVAYLLERLRKIETNPSDERRTP